MVVIKILTQIIEKYAFYFNDGILICIYNIKIELSKWLLLKS